MSQNDFTIANQGFPAFRADLNSALQALASNSSGATAPSTTFANMWWYDSANNIMYIRNEDNDAWIKFAELDQTNDKFVLSGTLQLDDGTVSAPALTFNSDTNMGIYRGGTDILKFVTAGTDAITINASQDVTLAGSLNFADNEKAIFGAGGDLQIYHDGSNSYIKEAGDGGLIVQASTSVSLQGTNTSSLATFFEGGSATFYHNNSPKLATSSTGIDVTGTASVNTGNVNVDNGYGYTWGTNAVQIYSNGSYMRFRTGGVDRMEIDTNANIVFNETGINADFRVESDANASMLLVDAGNNAVNIGNNDNAGGDLNVIGTATGSGVASNHRIVISSGNQYGSSSAIKNLRLDFVGFRDGVGDNGIKARINAQEITATSRETNLTFNVNASDGNLLEYQKANSQAVKFNDPSNDLDFYIESNNNAAAFYVNAGADQVQFGTAITEVTKIWFDNLESNDTYSFFGNNSASASNPPMFINRHASDGQLIQLRKGNAQIGVIGTPGNGDVYLSSGNIGLLISGSGTIDVYPCDDNGSARDNVADFGQVGARWDDIYATNGTIQTSDRNEKQDIEELTDAEQRVAVVAKGLMRKFRWKDKVAEKGDNARTHFGIIAQDLQDAFTAEGLDAGDYAMFTSSTWTDDDGNEQTRLGVRYNQLLAFIISAI